MAEDSLTVDILSGGRFRLGVAAGYRSEEFLAFGTSTRDRGSRMDEALDILRLAFSGQPFAHEGRHWSFPEITVTPQPIRAGGPEIWVGGAAPAAIQRAAAKGDGFLASGKGDVAAYLAARRALGFADDPPRTARTARLLIAEDPDRALHDLGKHMLFQVNEYVGYGFIGGPAYTDARDLLRDRHYEVVDAAGAVQRFAREGEAGVHEFHLMAVLPGEDVESSSARLAYVADTVIPAVRARAAAEPTQEVAR